jgi:methionyl-tRNA synthetase
VLEWFQADAIARYQKLLGKTVAFAAGADENSLKNVQAAEKAGKAAQDWLDEYAQIFVEAYRDFGIELTSFRRGSDQKLHWPGVQELWRRCDAAGDIYKKTYTGLYCVGCESFYTPDELVDGKCPEHLTVPETVTEENYFFRLSKYQKEVERLISSDELRIVSEQFKNEMLGFVRKGLDDFSVSRSVKRARGVGVPIPEDPDQIMYVWFDALTIYLTAIGWGYDQAQFEKTWPADVHIIGKGINRFHSVYWIGMLLSAALPLPKCVCVHGYITANGQKMSKSLGNVIDPFALVDQYGREPVRYYLLREIPTHADGDFSHDRFRELYAADLANGIGNLCSRLAKLCEKNKVSAIPPVTQPTPDLRTYFANHTPASAAYQQAMADYELSHALKSTMDRVASLDKQLSASKPWTLQPAEATGVLQPMVTELLAIAWELAPFLPETAAKIFDHFTQTQITALSGLFPRLNERES